ncbi:MAG: T4 RnlA family RNA ligase [Cyanobacteria bacterium SZAS TMP-1]|nr:T4 RnlA family RNA ligase [Cyanobacteria bacterium SZAS TMP-1]
MAKSKNAVPALAGQVAYATTQQWVERLSRFVLALVRARVKNSDDWRKWRLVKENEAFMEECFAYQREAGMPSVGNLIKPFFHPSLPLIGLNYTPVAHNTLHQFASGWTPAMRLCRGIVFTRRGRLVALPFPKFFNYGEHAETSSLPDSAFDATVKHDGHLGIIFEYGGELIATTRGSFVSSSSGIANDMLAPLTAAWKKSRLVHKDVTLLCEIIHPETHVIVDYGDRKAFILIGAFNRATLEDHSYADLVKFASKLDIEVTERVAGKSLADLSEMMKDKVYRNQEGIVVRFGSGLRVKLKYAAYVGKMVMDKVNHRYMMLRLMEGSSEKRFGDLPGEVQLLAGALTDELLAVRNVEGDKKAKWNYLYGLVPEEERTDYHRGICRKFYTWLVAQNKG